MYPTHRLLKGRNAVKFTRRFTHLLDLYGAGRVSFAELDASVQGWINHVRYADRGAARTPVLDPSPAAADALNSARSPAQSRRGGGRLTRIPSESGGPECQRTRRGIVF